MDHRSKCKKQNKNSSNIDSIGENLDDLGFDYDFRYNTKDMIHERKS